MDEDDEFNSNNNIVGLAFVLFAYWFISKIYYQVSYILNDFI